MARVELCGAERLRRPPHSMSCCGALACCQPLLPSSPCRSCRAEGVRAVFFPWLAPKPRLTGMQRQVAEEMAAEAIAAKQKLG